MGKVSAIVLAAGKSARMGPNKLLLPWGDSTVIGHVVQTVLDSQVDEALVVTGHDQLAVADAVSKLPCRIVFCADFEKGMGHSIASGVRAASLDSKGFLIALGDMPLITEELIQRVCELAQADQIIVPKVGERLGHPVLFGADFRSELMALQGDVGARRVLDSHKDRIVTVEISEASMFEDIDRPSDYLEFKRK